MDRYDLTRRWLLRRGALSLGAMALGSLMRRAQAGEPTDPLAARPPHFAAKATSIIHLAMPGAPSTIDLLDYKPKLNELNGQPCPESLIQGERFAFIKGVPSLLGSPHAFARHGQSGHWISALFPHLAKIADDIAVVKTAHTDQFNHAPAQIFQCTGSAQFGRPGIGSWLGYGLGSVASDLPAYVVMVSGQGAPDGGKACWGSGFLPSHHQGVEFRSTGDPVLFLSDPPGMPRDGRRAALDALNDFNRRRLDAVGDPEIATRIAAYELAYRMQTSVPELARIADEPESVRALYGAQPGQRSFGNNCLLARRLVERGVRFVQLFHRGWDHHGNEEGNSIVKGLPQLCAEVDQGMAALVTDLKQRGLLDTTLVVWGGEFGRTPMNEGRNNVPWLGRDHHPRAFAMWLAGGGIKAGAQVGETDDFGYNPVSDPVHVHDLNATILHLMGLDHERLTHRFQGRDFRLTDVHGSVVRKLIA